MKLRLPWKKKWLMWIVSALVMTWVLRDFRFETLADSLRSSRWELVGWAAVLNLIGITTCRVKRFGVLLDTLPHSGRGARFRELTTISLATRALNLALPARAPNIHSPHCRPADGLGIRGRNAISLSFSDFWNSICDSRVGHAPFFPIDSFIEPYPLPRQGETSIRLHENE